MKTITNEEIELAIKMMKAIKEDWETHKDKNFIKDICNRLSYEIEKLEKEKEQ